MKKIFGLSLLFAAVLFWGCNNNRNNADNNADNDRDMVYTDEHTSRNSLDYEGTYKGSLPCADCEKIEVMLTLGDDNYVRTYTYHKGDNTESYDDRGTYTWNEADNIITLNGLEDGPNKYFVGENQLIQLDMDGNRITGEFADMYILRK